MRAAPLRVFITGASSGIGAALAREYAARGADVVIASAGISYGTLTERLDDLPLFESVVATNLTATVATFAPFIGTMKAAAGPRRLVAIGSMAGIRGMKGAGAYCASKAAVHSYAESLRLEMRRYGIRVVTIAPGYIDTPMTSNNHFPMPFLMPAERFAAQALRAIDAGSAFRVIPWQMGVVARLLRMLPNALFDLLFARAPQKARKEAA